MPLTASGDSHRLHYISILLEMESPEPGIPTLYRSFDFRAMASNYRHGFDAFFSGAFL